MLKKETKHLRLKFLKPFPNWGRVKFSDSFLYETLWNWTIRHYKGGEFVFYAYEKNGDLISTPKVVSREYAIKAIKGYVEWWNRLVDQGINPKNLPR